MVQRKGGARRKTRGKFSRSAREKGKFSVSKFFEEFNDGEKVVLKANTSYQRGIYFRRFHGLVGTVVGKRGSCYHVAITDHTKDKTLIVHPVHLMKAR
ncbi:50S ribosomal protein L21e [Candidatus Woesearchaeota archaeon]|nr:50S ribosomal protein L21e [Candidatus Woesearchaeota archaeon]